MKTKFYMLATACLGAFLVWAGAEHAPNESSQGPLSGIMAVDFGFVRIDDATVAE